MNEQVIGWDDKVPVDEDLCMAEDNAGSPRNGDAATITAVHMYVASPNEVADQTVPRDGALLSAVGGDGCWYHNLVSRFGPLDSAVLSEVDVRGGERRRSNGVDAQGTIAAEDGDFQLMYMQRFLREAGEGTIPERFTTETTTGLSFIFVVV